MDIYCAVCGEPWSACGLHYTTSDLDDYEFFTLVNGGGCPCCEDNGYRYRRADFQPDPEHLHRWRVSVARASEGTVLATELEPLCLVYHRLLAQGTRRMDAAVKTLDHATITFEHIGAE